MSCRNGANYFKVADEDQQNHVVKLVLMNMLKNSFEAPARSLLFGPSILGFAGLGGVARQRHKDAGQKSLCQRHIMSSLKIVVFRMQI